jgi:hypothetical protein
VHNLLYGVFLTAAGSILRRLVRKPGGGVSFNDTDYRPQARRALVFGHNLLIHILVLQNSRFHLGMEGEVQECVKAFTEIWGQERTDTPQH